MTPILLYATVAALALVTLTHGEMNMEMQHWIMFIVAVFMGYVGRGLFPQLAQMLGLP